MSNFPSQPSSMSLRDPQPRQLGYQDAFGKMIADSTQNELDIASHYPYTPERWKLSVDGTRVFPEYGAVSEYEFITDAHKLTPSQGSTVVFETQERPRYVVQYELIASWAFQINQSLGPGDVIRVGLYDDNNGWYLEQTGSHDAKKCDLVIRRAGSEKKRVSGLDLHRPLTDWTRFATQLNWYNVGDSTWSQFFTEKNRSKLKDVGSIAIDDGSRGPEQGNLPLRYEITNSSGGLELEAGSVALITLGDTDAITRVKGADFVDNVGSTGSWTPIRAFRLQPEKDIVNAQLTQLAILAYSSDADIRILAMAMSRDKVSFSGSGWNTPEEWNSSNSALETRADVSSIPAQDGTTSATVSNPGGYQLGRSILIPVSGDFKKGATSGRGQEQKRSLPQSDYLVILGKSGATGDVTYELTTEQDY